MKRRILLFILLLLVTSTLLTGCENKKEKARIKSLVMNELETRYDEKFEIRRIFYDDKRSKWVLEVYPKENNIDDETFFAFVKKDPEERVIENYYTIKNSNLTKIYYRPIIKKMFKENKLRFWANVGIGETNLDTDKIKKIETIFNKIPKITDVRIFIYIFEDVTSTKEKKEAFIKEVWELFKYLKSQNLEWASITVNIYDEDFFKDKDIDHILKVSNWFSSWTSEFDVTEYWKKQTYLLRIREKDYKNIKYIKEIKDKLRKLDWNQK
ncbi:hypothetical protein [Haliovirga abyssi]|uniref:Lipoprotein n=1 Tax=Haliovirga abyssi TaxID=2996794 RepID=A0AAU9E048_9FUSO|nr:hypothetical protein [Haliovirga abyssi]BDU51245.1 hypothetical protein HLVA_18140 [Haliovirga abyssi]